MALRFSSVLLLSVACCTFVAGQTKQIAIDPVGTLELYNVTAKALTYKGRKAVNIEDAAPANTPDAGQMAIVRGTDFEDGVIEVDMSGDTHPNADVTFRGFVGIAFRVKPGGGKFECLYLRPLNARSNDQLQRNHTVQYISAPDFGWRMLREKFPAKYESYVDLAPGEWTKVKIEVRGVSAKLYVNGAAQPVLVVEDLKLGVSRGAIALWIGPGTVAHFAGLRVTP